MLRSLRCFLGAGALALALAGGACEGARERRLSEGEALSYKRQLLRENPTALSDDQVQTFGQHDARTKSSIDEAFSSLETQQRVFAGDSEEQ